MTISSPISFSTLGSMSMFNSATVTDGITSVWYEKSNSSDIPRSDPNNPVSDNVHRLNGGVGGCGDGDVG